MYLNFESTGPDLPEEYVDRILILLLLILSQKFVSLLQQFSCSVPFFQGYDEAFSYHVIQIFENL